MHIKYLNRYFLPARR